MSHLPALTLMAHEVDGPEGPQGTTAEAGFTISLDLLVDVIEKLRAKGYRFVALSEFLAERHAGGVALLTFDDGFERLHTHALPVLQRLRVPALCFLVTETLAEPAPATDWFPVWLFSLRDAYPKAGAEVRRRLEADPIVRSALDTLGADTLASLLSRPASRLFTTFYPSLSYAELDHLRSRVADLGILERLGLDRSAVLEMAGSGVFEFGAHSVTHVNLAQVPVSEVDRQVVESLRSIAALAGTDPRDVPFAYPYGQVSPAARRVVDRAGRVGFTVAERAHLRGDALSLLPRLTIDETVVDRALRAPSYVSLVRERLGIRAVPSRERARHVKNRLRRPGANRAEAAD